MARAARDQYRLDKILFVPAFIPPHKKAQRDLTPAPYRYSMVELAIHGEEGCEICDLELNRPEISYTVDTLQGLKKRFPAAELYLIIGADTLPELSTWKEPDQVRKLAVLLVAPRRGFPVRESMSPRVRSIQMEECPVSSSEIRRAFAEGRSLPEGILPAAVADYIQTRRLYRKGA